jgi:hypothetical protein
MNHLLSNAGSAALSLEPFPHLVLDNALDADTYQMLVGQFPAVDAINRRAGALKNNHLYLLSAPQVLLEQSISQACRDFFAYHVSNAFWQASLPLLREALLRIFPDLEAIAGRPLEEFRSVMRQKDVTFSEEISLDCQFGVNSPVTKPSSVRSPHIDRPNKLFNALLYCREPGDETPGGELLLYRATGPLAHAEGSSVMPTRIAEVKRVAYRANRLVFFLSSPWSVHGVAPRPKTTYFRRYVNFMCEFRQPLFEVPRLPPMLRMAETLGAAVSARLSKREAEHVQEV